MLILRHQSGRRGAARGTREGTARRRAGAGRALELIRAAEREAAGHACASGALDRATRGGVHQGILAVLKERERTTSAIF